jgi:dolichol-phosphate mannosyltransferase
MIRSVPRATVCLPTYDERENLEPMIRALGEVLGPDDRVLVIDDSSPDGTGEIADRLAQELDWVDVLHRPRKEGLGRAYLDGFRHALAAGAELVLELDCDFSHDPKDVPRLIAAAEGADLVLGSRYVAGGGTANWGLLRRAISRWGSLYAQILLGLPVKDLTGGFKCYRRVVLEAIDLDAIDSRGYAFQIETTYRAIRAGFRVVEIPIRFTDRQVGGSKMSHAIVLEAVWKVPALRLAALRGRL